MTSDDLADAIDRLYATPPDAFISERDQLVRSLKAVDKQAAAQVKALRRPPVSAWALNQVARSRPQDLAALGEADAALARAQRSGEGREALAEAGSRRRALIRTLLAEAVSVLAAGGHPDSPATRDRMAQTLAAIAVDEAGRQALLQGRLTQDLTPASLWEAPVPARSWGAPVPAEGPGIPPKAEPGEHTDGAAGPDDQMRAQLAAAAQELQARAEALDAEAGAMERRADRAANAAERARQAATVARRAALEAATAADLARQALDGV